MDRSTIKNLLMTTSVVALVAAGSEEARAVGCGTFIDTPQPAGVAQNTSVNCILIDATTVTGDVTIGPSAVIGSPGGIILDAVELFDATVTGGVINNGTVQGILNVTGGQHVQIGIDDFTSKIGNGITNSSTGHININVTDFLGGSTASAFGAGIVVLSESFTGTVANNGAINVSVFADPVNTAIAEATGMAVVTGSFSGNVINTNAISLTAVADAGSAGSTSAFARSRVRGVFVSGPTADDTITISGGSNASPSVAATFLGNVTNSGVITITAVSTALAGTAGAGATAQATADGMLITGPSVHGIFTNTGSGTLAATLTDVFIGNIHNGDTIQSNATAFATNGTQLTPVAGAATALTDANAFGIRLVGDIFSGNITNAASTSTGSMSLTAIADLAANISNTDTITATALSRATAFSSSGTAIATAIAHAVGIDVVGVSIENANILSTSLADTTDTFNATFTGNITNTGGIRIASSATAVAGTTGLGQAALVNVTQDGVGIQVIGANVSGTQMGSGGGDIVNNLNATFLGNITNAGAIVVQGTARGTADVVAGTGLSSVVINSNDAGISVIGSDVRGSFFAGGIGSISNVSTFTFNGNIANSASGVIQVTDTAFGEVDRGTNGHLSGSVHASAGGIRLIGAVIDTPNNTGNFVNNVAGVFLTGSVTNAGTIQATALSSLSLSSGGGTATLDTFEARADARGIAVLGAVFTGEASMTGTFTGNIANSGVIFAFASANIEANLPTISNPFGTADAHADGILAVVNNFNGNVTNSRAITVVGIATNTAGTTLGGTSALAFADGIDVRVSTFTGSIGNSLGVIRAFASAQTNGTGAAMALADANGIYASFGFGNTFTGNIGNTGSIFVQANATGISAGATAVATAGGISLTGGEEVTGTVSNGAGGLIMVGAIAVGNTGANATATGIAVDASGVFGDVINNGMIVAKASATALNGITSTATAQAAGIHVGDAGGPFQAFFSGNIANTGTMLAFATAVSSSTAFAGAEGILVANTFDGSGHLTIVPDVEGNIINSGNIQAQAFSRTKTGTSANAGALAAGMFIAASDFIGNVSNGGTIFAQAGAEAGGATIFGSPTATAQAFGIGIIGGTHDDGSGSFFLGNVTNSSSGVITATSSAVSDEFEGVARARAAGIAMSLGTSNFSLFGISTISGAVINQGLIMSTASAHAARTAIAVSYGIEALFSTFAGNVSNSGTVLSTALATVVDGSLQATAGGIVLAGTDNRSGFTEFASLFSGNVTNSGVVQAIVIGSGPTHGTGTGIGILIDSSAIFGTVTNTSGGLIIADASLNIHSDSFVRSFGSVFADGIAVKSVDFFGNVANSGTIAAHALAVQSGEGGRAFASANGILVQTEFFEGNITNASGLITAFSTASATGNGTIGNSSGNATAIANAAGINLEAIEAIATIANTGTLVHVSTFVGNVRNAGTIIAVGTAIAFSNTAVATAYDPATGIRVNVALFEGGVTQSGLIIAQATADASGKFGAIAKALAAGIAVNGTDAGLEGDNLFREGVFVGEIVSSGTIMANASAHANARIDGLGTIEAGATGIRVFASAVIGNVTNNGLIVATATGVNSSAFLEPGRSHEFGADVFAAGIHIGGVTGDLGNFAQVSTFIGDINNTGTVIAFATSSNAGEAYAAGIQVDTFSGMIGTIDNAAKAVLSASAAASVDGTQTATAIAHGIYLQGISFVGAVTNEGTIMASASASGHTAVAEAAGIYITAFGGAPPFGVITFLGDISNSGVIAAGATAISPNHSAFAAATGILVSPLTYIGNITNTGTISAFATANAQTGGLGNQEMFAGGIVTGASTFVGNISNNGGVIMAQINGPSNSSGLAEGIGVFATTFLGNVNNTGTISASSHGPGLSAIGVLVGFGNTFIGNINNAGLIVATGDATGIYSFPATFVGAINNTGTIIGQGGATDRGIRVIGPSITDGINNSGTIQGGFASIDTDQETGPGTTINNKSQGLLKGDVRLSATADTLNVFGGSTVMGNISGNVIAFPGGGPHGIGNADVVNFDLTNDGSGGTLSPSQAISVYQYKINDVDTVNLLSGTLILDDQDIVGTVTLGPGNIDPVGVYNQTAGSTLGLVVDVGHFTTLGPGTPPTVKTITMSAGPAGPIGAVLANTIFISSGATFKAYEEPDFYADKNIYPNVVVALTSMNGNYLNDGTHVLSNSPLLNAFMVENGSSSGAPGQDTLVLTRRNFNNPLGGGLTPNEKQAANGIEGLYGTGNSTALTIIPPLFGLTGPQYAAVLKSLDGETILERPDLWQTVLDSILHRLSQGEGFNGQGFASAMLNHGPVQVASAGWSDNDGLVAQTTPMPGPTGYVQPWSVWVRGYGVTASGPATINATAIDETRYGGIGGIDYHLSDNLLIGGIFNYAHGEVKLAPPTPAKNKQDAYQFAAYGKYQQGPWYVNAVVGGGFTDNDESRTVLIPKVAPVSASYSGESIMAYAEAGWDLYPMSNLKLTPLVGVGYNWLRYDGFQETGSPSALHVQAATTNNLYTALGARAQTAINIGTAAPLVPEVRVVWEHEFLDANQEMNAAFGGGPLFNEQGSKFSRESVIAGVGISNNVAPDLKLFLD
ncbi:MAG TPA: autotransporter domain-containing protein, partial [Stellaceae bacterium]|nr:autotransporter domain-containing protein [Stellaceae bacterium]